MAIHKRQKLNGDVHKDVDFPEGRLLNEVSSIMNGITDKDGVITLTLKSLTGVSIVQEVDHLLELFNDCDEEYVSRKVAQDVILNTEKFDYEEKVKTLQQEVDVLKEEKNDTELNTKYIFDTVDRIDAEFSSGVRSEETEKSLLREYYDHFDDVVYYNKEFYVRVEDKVKLKVEVVEGKAEEKGEEKGEEEEEDSDISEVDEGDEEAHTTKYEFSR